MALTEDQKTSLLAVYDQAGKDGDTAAQARIKDIFTSNAPAPDEDAPGMGGPAPANTFVDPHTGQPTNPAPLKPFSEIATQGIEEPAIRAAEGAGDVVGQFARQDTQDSYKSMVDARRAKFAQDNPGTSEGLEDFGAGALTSAIPLGAASKTTTFFGGLLKGMQTGGLAADAQYTPKGQSKASQVATGAGAGGIFAMLSGAIPAVRNIASRAVAEAEKNPRVQEVVNAAKGFFKGATAVPTPAPYTVAQASASPALGRLEGRAFGPKLQELGATQVDQTISRFKELADQAEAIAKVPATSESVASGVNKALDATVSGMRTERSTGFKKGMADVLAADSAVPAATRAVIPLTNLQDAYETALKQDANAFNIHGAALPAGFQTALDALKDATAKGATGVRIPTLQAIMQGLGQDAQHGAGTFLSPADQQLERYRKMLFDGLQKDIDAAGVKAGPSNPAYAKLLEVRKNYAQQSDAIRRVESDSITRLFGSPDALANPAAALDQFYKLKSDDQRYAIDLIGRKSPETLRAMQAHQIRTAIEDSRTAGAAKDSEFDLAAFNKTMFAQGRGDSPLWQSGGVTADQVRQGGAHLRVLLNQPPGGPGSVVGPEDVAINVTAMNPAFMARAATRIVYGTQGDVLLGTAEGLKALRTLASTTSRKSQTYAAAVAWMVNQAKQAPPSAQPNQ